MSFTGLNYDTGAYRQSLKESMGPGRYMLDTPTTQQQPCTAARLTDNESELWNIRRQLSACPGDGYRPGQGAELRCALPEPGAAAAERLRVEDTRFSNPPCTLRGTGVNRWTPLCDAAPQSHVISPIPFMASDRTQAKDNHRALLHTPMGAGAVLPPPAPEHVQQPVYEFEPVPMLPEVLPRRPFGLPEHVRF
jgi:hypothetical protein